jgi:GntR family transcriptional regulator, transcriptional repressor for pyruvate dehydrogenase complex
MSSLSRRVTLTRVTFDSKPGGPAVEWAEPLKARRIFEEVLDQLEAALASGQLAAGDRLPNERELAAAFGVSRASIREALRVLETLGLIDIPRGPDGVRLRTEPGNAFAHLLRLHLALGHYDPGSVVELRVVLESWAAAKLASNTDEGVLAALDQSLRRMADPSLTPEAFNALDVEFHATIVEGCGNELIALVLRGCRRVIQQAMLQGLNYGEWETTRADLQREHRRLVEFIKARDSASASHFMEDHIHRWAWRTLSLDMTSSNGEPSSSPRATAMNVPPEP